MNTIIKIIIFLLIPSLALGSEIVLKSGQKVEGKIVEQTDKYVKFDAGVGVIATYYADEIDTVDGQKLLAVTPTSVVSAGKTYAIYLKSGGDVIGKVVEATNEYIKLDAMDGIKTYYRVDIQKIVELRVEALPADQQKAGNKAMEIINNNLKTTFESVQKNCDDFAEKLKKCEPYECTYVYFGGMPGKKKIIGFENNKCHSEEIAGSHKLDCRYSKATVNAENPLQVAMNNGECVDADGATPIIGGHIEMGNVKP